MTNIKRTTGVLAVALASTVSFLAVGCGGGDKNAQTPQNDPNAMQQQPYPQQQQPYPQQQQPYPQQQQPYPQQQGQYPQQPPPAAGTPAAGQAQGQAGLPLNPLDPNFLQQAAAAAAAAMGPAAAAAGVPADPAEAGLKMAATKHAPKMNPDGGEAKQAIQEGQHVTMPVTLNPGTCYTIIGFSPLGGVKDLNLTLMGPAPLFNLSAGQDSTADNTPVIGSGKAALCPASPFPMQYKVDIFAKSGSGNVVVQMYSRPK